MRWFSGEILNSPDTRKSKTHFCQYYRGYQTYHTYQAFLWCLKALKMLYKISKSCGYGLLQNYLCCLATQNGSRQSVSWEYLNSLRVTMRNYVLKILIAYGLLCGQMPVQTYPWLRHYFWKRTTLHNNNNIKLHQIGCSYIKSPL